jgi:predicted tellurium resistance membrane protein TerC
MLMDKYPIIITIGAALLGKVGAEMIITDPVLIPLLPTGDVFSYLVEGGGAIGVVVAGKLLVWVFQQQSREKLDHL